MEVYVVLGKFGGFVDVFKTREAAEELMRKCEEEAYVDNTETKDSFEIVAYDLNEEAQEVYIMLSISSNAPIYITTDREKFSAAHKSYINLCLTYIEDIDFWKHEL